MQTKAIEDVKHYINQHAVTLAGRLFARLLPYRKTIVLENMQFIFGQYLTTAELNKLRLLFYTHLARSLSENLRLRFMSQKKLASLAIVEGHEHVLNVAKANKGVLILTGHFGNWELAPLAGILNFTQFQGRFHFIRRIIGFKWLEKILFRRFYQAGLNVITKPYALRKACTALENNDAVVFILDQHASTNGREGIKVDFFAYPAGTYRSLATLATQLDLPVVPATSFRRADGKHVLKFTAALPVIHCDNYQKELQQNTLQYNKVLEQFILEHPDQWLWFHRRFKPE